MFGYRFATVVHAARRAFPALGLASALIFVMIGPPGSVHADDPIERDHRGEGQPALPPPASPTGPAIVHDHRDPAKHEPTRLVDAVARVQLVIRKVIIHTDQDGGIGEINLRVYIRANDQPCPRRAVDTKCGRPLVALHIPEFNAAAGDVIGFNRVIPGTDDAIDPTVSLDLGIPLRASEWAGFTIAGTESDLLLDDDMGDVDADIVDANGAFRVGTFTERSLGACIHDGHRFCDVTSFGAFSVEYEIRRVPLPDLPAHHPAQGRGRPAVLLRRRGERRRAALRSVCAHRPRRRGAASDGHAAGARGARDRGALRASVDTPGVRVDAHVLG